jgi:transcriptional regulator with PAS, ATPase and Fis domain
MPILFREVRFVIDYAHPEIIAVILSSIGGIFGMFTLAWKKIAKPLIKLCKSQDFFMESVEEIRKELKTNGGSSLKDAIIDMKATCHRIEKRQKVIEQRTKAALHYSEAALFETDTSGRLIWSNANFCKYVKDNPSNVTGFDWLSMIKEDERDELLNEFLSCVKMNRKFSKTTETQDNKNIRMLGYPYRITDSEHGGFLVSIIPNEEV